MIPSETVQAAQRVLEDAAKGLQQQLEEGSGASFLLDWAIRDAADQLIRLVRLKQAMRPAPWPSAADLMAYVQQPARDDAECRFGPITSDPADAERNIRQKENAERAAYLARWKYQPVWVNFLSQDADGQCKGWNRKPELQGGTWISVSSEGMWGFVDSLRGALGSVRVEPRPTPAGGQGVEG